MNSSSNKVKMVKLEEICEIFDSSRKPINNQERELRVSGKSNEQLFPYYGATGQVGWIDDYLFDEELILLGEDGVPFYDRGKAKAYLVNGRIWVNNHAHVIRAKDGIAINRFICFYLNTFNYRGFVTGATRLKLNQKAMKRIPIPLPPLPEQKRIAEILDGADEARRKRRENLSLYDDLIRSLFLKTFGDPVSNPMGWETVSLGILLSEIIGGKSVGGEARALARNEFGVIKISAVTSGAFKPCEYKVVSTDDLPRKLIRPLKGDLLFSRANTREMVGATCIVREDYKQLFLPDKIWKLKLVPERLSADYLKCLLTHEGFRWQLRKVATGTSGSMLNISKAKLRSLEIPVPPIKMQNEFAEQIEEINLQKTREQVLYDQHDDLFNALLQRAFKGEL